jgi:YidC/Oxa1 family membrane protein insertase
VELWHAWTALLQHLLKLLAVDLGLGFPAAIIILTIAVRGALLPLTWSLLKRAALRQEKLSLLAPRLAAIRERYSNDLGEQLTRTLELYRRHGLRMVDRTSLVASLVQLPVIYGLYQALREGMVSAAFLWVRNLARPDTLMAIIAAMTTAAVVAVAPHAPESLHTSLILLPAILCFAAALHFSAGLALYWSTSNLLSAGQAVVLKRVMRSRGVARSSRASREP